MTKPTKASEPRQTKLDKVRALLMAPEGASLAALCTATGWQAHSARAALSVLRKSGYTIERVSEDDGSVYRITEAPKAKP
jgi:DNA-binding transcriptional regulator PaaX